MGNVYIYNCIYIRCFISLGFQWTRLTKQTWLIPTDAACRNSFQSKVIPCWVGKLVTAYLFNAPSMTASGSICCSIQCPSLPSRRFRFYEQVAQLIDHFHHQKNKNLLGSNESKGCMQNLKKPYICKVFSLNLLQPLKFGCTNLEVPSNWEKILQVWFVFKGLGHWLQ